jgi:hypothetical protein
MAILAEFQAHVYVDRVQASEYDDPDEEPSNPNEVIKYVEVQSGGFFEVKCIIDHSYKFKDENALCCDVYLDGSKNRIGRLLRKRSFEDDRSAGRPCRIRINGKNTMEAKGPMLYKFQFADLETREMLLQTRVVMLTLWAGDLTTQDDIASFKEQYGGLGTMLVKISRVNMLDQIPGSAASGKDLDAVPEKALKGRPLDVATK